MFEELQLSSVIFCYGPLVLVVGGFIAFAVYSDILARRLYLRNTDPRPEEERPQIEPFPVSKEMVAMTPAGYKVLLKPDPVEPEVAEVAEADDLKRIEGIGPKMESVLIAAGITTFEQLAAKTPEELRAILDEADVAQIINPESWPEQASFASKRNWEALQKIQDKLNAGRKE